MSAAVISGPARDCSYRGVARAQEPWHFIYPEQRHIEVRDPARLPKARLPDVPPPATVSSLQAGAPEQFRSLDEAIRIALANSNVIRVLAGVTAVASGNTIYHPAISNTEIDQARARFDPALSVQNQFNRRDVPQGVFDPPNSTQVRIEGTRVDDYNMTAGLSKNTVTGGTMNFGVNTDPTRAAAQGLPLNPQTPTSVDLGYTQPLLQGAGPPANLAPILIARVNTERSFFQMKDSVQQLVRGTIEAYWALVAARTEALARRGQLQQAEWARQRAEAQARAGAANQADVAQAQAAAANFHASLIAAEANVLQREAALRNIMGLPPSGTPKIVPVTPPDANRRRPDWSGIVRLAEQYRPDLVELKLVLEADQQQLLVARNQALPRLDANALYRWDGLQGWTPDRTQLSTNAGEFYEWQLGVNFSVPLGLREGRARMRGQELILTRDRANLDQGLHSAVHTLAASCRNLDQFYEQYKAYETARRAALQNLDYQWKDYDLAKRRNLLDVLQAAADWGNSVSAEAQALTQYNTELANLEQQTGTILETHGIRFAEERYGSIGPLGRLFADRRYPRDVPPGPNADRYRSSPRPAEEFFELRSPVPPGFGAPSSPPVPRPRIEIPEPPEPK